MIKKIFVTVVFLLSLVSTWSQNAENQKERVVYVPYEQLEQLFKKEGKGIYVLYEDYERLVKLAEKAEQKPQELPALVLISSANYSCKVQEQFLHVDAKYTLDVLQEGWHKFPLGFENIGIKKALLDGKPAFLSLNGNSYELIFQRSETGKQTLEVSFVVPIHFGKTMDAKVHFKVPRSPIAHLDLNIPHKKDTPKVKVEISPSLTSTVTETEDSLRLTSLLGNTDNIQMNWQAEAERKVEIKQIVHAENTSILKVGENFLNLLTIVKYDLIQGKINHVNLEVPEGFTVFSVKSAAGQGINDWTLDKEKNILYVNFLADVEDSGEGKVDLELEIKLEKIIKNLSGQFPLPKVEALAVEREKGFYTIGVDDLHTLKIISRKDISQLDLNDLPSHIKKDDIQFAFKYLKKPYTLEVELTKIDPEYEVTTNISAYLEETIYKLYANFDYDIKKSRIFQTKIEIPAGFMILNIKAYDLSFSSTEDQIKEYFVREDENALAITFKKGMKTKNLVIQTQWQKKFDKEMDEREIALPVFKVVGAKRELGNIGLGVKSSFSITTVGNSQKNVLPLDINQLFSTGNRPPQQKTDIGLRYYGHPIDAKFKIEKRDPFVTAEVFDYISMSENVLKHDFRIFYTVKYTGVKEFSFTLPSDIAVNVPKSRISDPQNLIKEIDIQEQKEEKTHLYKVSTQRDILDSDFQLYVSYEEKLKQIDEGKVLKFNIFELITQNTKRENGFLVFKKNNNLSLDFADANLLETTDINDRNFAPRGDKTDVLAIFKYFSHGYSLTIILQKLQFEPVLNTVINRLHISTTVNKDLTTQNEAVVCLINNRKQFLDFTVPVGSKVTSVGRLTSAVTYRRPAHEIDQYLDPITPSKKDGEEGYRVNISSNVKKEQPFVLVIKYNCPIQGGEMKMHGNFQVDPIQFGNIPVTNFTWDLGLPTEYRYIQFDSSLVRNYYYNYNNFGIWHALVDIPDVDKSVIKQDAETGVIPIYDIQGRLFSFSRLSGDGYIKVEYIHNNWIYSLYLIAFLIVWFIVAVIPKIKIMSRLNLSLLMGSLALLLGTSDIQGYGYMGFPILLGVFAGIGGAFVMGIVRIGTPSANKKVHTIYREEKKEISPAQNSENNDSEQNNNTSDVADENKNTTE